MLERRKLRVTAVKIDFECISIEVAKIKRELKKEREVERKKEGGS